MRRRVSQHHWNNNDEQPSDGDPLVLLGHAESEQHHGTEYPNQEKKAEEVHLVSRLLSLSKCGWIGSGASTSSGRIARPAPYTLPGEKPVLPEQLISA